MAQLSFLDDDPTPPRSTRGAYGRASQVTSDRYVGAPYAAEGTSRQAAERIVGAAGTLRRQVYEFIRDRGEHGATDEEIATGLGMNPSTVRPRRGEAQEAGLIVDSGLTRKTASGRAAIVWRASEAES